ncbi:glycosyltransferase family 2 protein [Rhodohalobacter sp. 8-1]|uniref:glycosyltransferase family 2 protein n=1 Tax=Rhodohalobacter sp. 8-1 TaxID=3131972 RepID=UPI0030EE2EB5
MKLSIITINYNNKTGLIKTVESVIHQTFQDFEYIIIDGGSTDGSKEYIQQMQEHFDYWVSEPDKGIYNAMNKGIKVAKGEYCLFLNSGDMLYDDFSLVYLFKNSFEEDIVYTNCYFHEDDNTTLKKKTFPIPENLTMDFFWKDMLCHQAMIFKRKFLENYSKYDEKYKLASDLKLVATSIVFGKATLKKVEIFLSVYDLNGQSASSRYLYEDEKRKIFQEDFSFFYEDYCKYEKTEYELNAIRNHFLIKILKKIKNFLVLK